MAAATKIYNVTLMVPIVLEVKASTRVGAVLYAKEMVRHQKHLDKKELLASPYKEPILISSETKEDES